MSEDSKAESPVKQLESKFAALKVYIFHACAVGNKLSQPVRDGLVGEPKEIKDGDISVENFAMLRQQVDDQIPSLLDVGSRKEFLALARFKAQLKCLESACKNNINPIEYLSTVDDESMIMEKADALEQQIFKATGAIQKASLNIFDQGANDEAERLIGICNQMYGHFGVELRKDYDSSTAMFAREYIDQIFSPFSKEVENYHNLSLKIESTASQIFVPDKKASAEGADFVVFQAYIQEKLQEVRRISQAVVRLQADGTLEAKKLEEFKKNIRECMDDGGKAYENYLKKATGLESVLYLSRQHINRIDNGKSASAYAAFCNDGEHYLNKLQPLSAKKDAKGNQQGSLYNSSSALLSGNNPSNQGRPPTPPKDQGLSINSSDPQATPQGKDSLAKSS